MDEVVNEVTGEIVMRGAMPAEIVKAVLAVSREVKTLGTDSTNQHARYSYVSIDKFIEVIGPKLAAAGLVIAQDEEHVEIRQGAPDEQGKVRSALFVRYAFRLMHESGATWGPVYRSVAVPATGPQAYGAAESYMMKRFMRSLFMIPTGEKDADDTQEAPLPPTNHRATAQQATAANGAENPRRVEATALYRALRNAIDSGINIAAVSAVMVSPDGVETPDWANFKRLVREVDPATADGVIGGLEERAEKRKEMLRRSAYAPEERDDAR